MSNGADAVDDDELLYRRVPESTDWYDPSTNTLKAEAFQPNRDRDTTGLSLVRAKHKSIQEAARGTPGKSYFVAIVRVGDLRQREIGVVSRPILPDGTYDPAHVELPDLRAETRKESITLERQRILANDLCIEVKGPYTT